MSFVAYQSQGGDRLVRTLRSRRDHTALAHISTQLCEKIQAGRSGRLAPATWNLYLQGGRHDFAPSRYWAARAAPL